jgi:hypothetical protein
MSIFDFATVWQTSRAPDLRSIQDLRPMLIAANLLRA